MKRLAIALCLTLFTLACVPSGPLAPVGEAGTGIATDALSNDVIIAQPFDSEEVSVDQAAPPPEESIEEAAPALAGMAEVEPVAGEPEALPAPSFPEAKACVKRGGLWVHAGKSIAFTCVKLTRDSGKQCRRGSDCQGACLARSMTCAPYDPMFGCNEILQDDGARVTLCID